MFVVLAILGLSVLIFFHELGHFILAKIFKIRVEEFGLGYPPRIFGFIFSSHPKLKFFLGKKQPLEAKSKTIYSLNWIPFGGFNKIKGELGEDDSVDSFYSQVWWKKALVASGGFLMNIFLAFLLFSLCFFIGLPQNIDEVSGEKMIQPVGIQIGMIYPDSPAEKAGLKLGDIITEIDGQEFSSVEQVQNYIDLKKGGDLQITVKRKGGLIRERVEVFPANQVFLEEEENTRGVIGVALSETVIASYSWLKSITQGAKTTILLVGQIFTGLGVILKSLITKGEVVGRLMGPVGITALASDMARVGFVYFVQFVGLLSVAIGVFQMIPFPALDGSRVLFSLIEGVRGRKMKVKTEMIIINAGFYFLLLLLIFITSKEIFNLF
jgi:regulator of sigma E protease